MTGVRHQPSDLLGQPLVAVDDGVLLEKPASIPHVEAASLPDAEHAALIALDNAKAGKSSSMPPRAASAPSSAASPAARRFTPRQAPATRNSPGRWAPTRSTRRRISETRLQLSTSSTVGGDVYLRSQSALKSGGLLVCLDAVPVPDSPRREDIRVSTPPVSCKRAGVKRIAALEGAVRAPDSRRNVRAGSRRGSLSSERNGPRSRQDRHPGEARPAVPQGRAADAQEFGWIFPPAPRRLSACLTKRQRFFANRPSRESRSSIRPARPEPKSRNGRTCCTF